MSTRLKQKVGKDHYDLESRIENFSIQPDVFDDLKSKLNLKFSS